MQEKKSRDLQMLEMPQMRDKITDILNKEYEHAGGAVGELLDLYISLRKNREPIQSSDWNDFFLALNYLMSRLLKLGQSHLYVSDKLSNRLSILINGEYPQGLGTEEIEKFADTFPDLSGQLGKIFALNYNTPHEILLKIHDSCKHNSSGEERECNCSIVITSTSFLHDARTPLSILRKHSESDDEKVRVKVASNPSLDDSLMLDVWLNFANRGEKILVAIASNPMTPVFILEAMSKSLKLRSVTEALEQRRNKSL